MIINRCWRCMEDLGAGTVCPKCGYDPSQEKTLTYALKPNTILHGKYLVGKVLGQGGFGITYIGFDLTLELKVAIKEYFPFNQASRNTNRSCSLSWQGSQSENEVWRNGCSRFLAEARKMAKINAVPEIVSVRDTFEENKTAYIVMDFVPGMTLREHVKRHGVFSYDECMDLLLPLIDGLEKIHRQGIIHRDISPSNLMLTPQGKVFLLDLGAAKDMKNSSGNSEMVATKGYSPLEQYANSNQTGPWSDVYSMTASIYYCLFGKTPPAAVDRADKDILDLKGKTKKPLTSKQISVLKKGMSVRKENRYQSAMELLRALRDARKKKTSAGLVVGAALAGIAAVVAAAAFLIVQKPWLPSVEQIGMESPYLEKNLIVTEDTYKYIVDLDGNLQRITYDEDDQVFYVDSGEVIYEADQNEEGSGITGLMVGGDSLYATYYGGAGKTDYLIRFELDGTDPEEIFELNLDHTPPQYVKLSDGEEYFYYLMDSGEEEDVYHLNVYRYNLSTDTEEQITFDDPNWYCVYDKYLYYTVWDSEEKIASLKRVTLAGENVEVLDEDHGYTDGFVDGGKLYLLQRTTAEGEYSVGLVQTDAKGQPVEEGKGVFNVPWYDCEWTVGGGWVYYWKNGTKELRRVRLDGSGDGTVFNEYAYEGMSYHDGELYFRDGYADEEGTFYPTQVYLAGYDGSSVVSCGMESTSVQTSPDGFEYQIENGEVKLKGYAGNKTDVIVPDTIDGYPVSRDVNWDTFRFTQLSREQVNFYKMMDVSELTYTMNGDGVTITDYSGIVTGSDYDNVAIPSEIDGKPVIELGDQAFQKATFENVYLPEKLQKIGEEAFDNCKNLQHVVIPDTLVDIGNYAFYGCKLDGEEIVLPEGLTDIGMGAFFYCTPKSVYLPSTLASVGDGFMAGCGGEYIVSPDHELIRSTDGIILSKSGTIFYAFPYDRTGTYTVPKGVVKIFDGAFYASRLNKVILPDSVTIIAERAFIYTENLKSITIPKGLEEIESRAFVGTGLSEIKIPYDCKVASDAFDDTLKVRYVN